MLWALLVFNCPDMNNCIVRKTFHQSEAACETRRLVALDRLAGSRNLTTAHCAKTNEGESK